MRPHLAPAKPPPPGPPLWPALAHLASGPNGCRPKQPRADLLGAPHLLWLSLPRAQPRLPVPRSRASDPVSLRPPEPATGQRRHRRLLPGAGPPSDRHPGPVALRRGGPCREGRPTLDGVLRQSDRRHRHEHARHSEKPTRLPAIAGTETRLWFSVHEGGGRLEPAAPLARSIQAWRLGTGGSRLQLLHAARAVVDEESCRSFSLAPRPGWGFAQRQTLGQERSVGAVEKTAKRGASPLPALGLVEWHRS